MTRTCNQPNATTRTAPSLQPECPFISIILPVRNEVAFIERTLDQLLGQDYPPERFEVLVADGQSTDATPERVRNRSAHHANLLLLDNPRRLSSAGRNRCIRAARGDLLAVIDGHCDLRNPRYLRDLADAFARSGADCVGRPQPLDVTEATVLQRAIAAARSSRLGHHPASYIYADRDGFVRPQSVAIAYRRAVFDAIGLFDETFDACEDVEFNHRLDRAGLRCFFTPRVQVHYYPRASLAGLFQQMVRYGRGRVRLLRKHLDTFTLPGFVPAAFVLGVVTGPLLALLSLWLTLAYAGCLGLYGVLVLLACVTCAMRTGEVRVVLWLPLVFLTIHTGAGCGQLQELLAGIVPPWRREQPLPQEWRRAA